MPNVPESPTSVNGFPKESSTYEIRCDKCPLVVRIDADDATSAGMIEWHHANTNPHHRAYTFRHVSYMRVSSSVNNGALAEVVR